MVSSTPTLASEETEIAYFDCSCSKPYQIAKASLVQLVLGSIGSGGTEICVESSVRKIDWWTEA
jgi:hypothetical protein